jgi:hypothetical protein
MRAFLTLLAGCIIAFWEHQHETAVTCPICRQRLSLLLVPHVLSDEAVMERSVCVKLRYLSFSRVVMYYQKLMEIRD